jgi:hypothetical protein
MKPMKYQAGRFTLLSVSVLGMLFCRTLSFAGEAEGDLKRVLNAWEQRRNSTHSIRYEVIGDVVVPKGRHNEDVLLETGPATGDYPSSDYRFEKRFNLAVDFDANHFRKELRREIFHGNLGRYLPQYIINTFDGSAFKGFAPRQENTGNGYTPSLVNPDIALGGTDLTNYSGQFFLWDEYPMFFAHGIFNTAPDAKFSLKKSVDPTLLRVHGHSLQDKQPRVVLRTASNESGEFDEIWVDLERSAAITRWINYRPDRVAAVTDIQYQETPQGWLPLTWTMTFYEKKDWIDASYNNRVVKVVVNGGLDPAELALEREKKPGMVLIDQDGTLFIVEADGSLSPLRLGPDGQPIGRLNWFWYGLWELLGLGGLGLAFWAIAHYLVKKKKGLTAAGSP